MLRYIEKMIVTLCLVVVAGSACSERVVSSSQAVQAQRVSVAPGTDLQRLVDAAPDGDTIELRAGTFTVGTAPGGVRIPGSKRLTIIGQGHGRTVIRLSRNPQTAFTIGDSVQHLTIARLTIRGDSARCSNTEAGPHGQIGIMLTADSRDVRDLAFTDLELVALNVGIELFEHPNLSTEATIGSARVVVIERNLIRGMRGAFSGCGYGLQNADVESLTVRDNVIIGADRHAIYQARSLRGPVWIVGNTIIDHARTADNAGLSYPAWRNAALPVARSQNVIVAHNTVVNPYNVALSVEYDDLWPAAGAVRDVFLIDNTVIGGHDRDLWVNVLESRGLIAWGNRFIRFPGNRVSSKDPASGLPAPPYWTGTQAMTRGLVADDSNLFMMRNNILHRVTPRYGTVPDASWSDTYSTTTWAPAFQALESPGDGFLYAMQNGVLYRVAPGASGTQWIHTPLSPGWTAFQAMGTLGGSLYVAWGGTNNLARVSRQTASPELIASFSRPVYGMVSGADRLFVLSGSCLYTMDQQQSLAVHDCLAGTPERPVNFRLQSVTTPEQGGSPQGVAELAWDGPFTGAWEIYQAAGASAAESPPDDATQVAAGPEAERSARVTINVRRGDPGRFTYWIRFTNPASQWAGPVQVNFTGAQ